MIAQGYAMLSGRIALVPVPPVDRVLPVQLDHMLIAVGFCQDGCRSNGSVESIALHNAGVAYLAIGLETIAINDQVPGVDLQAGQCPVHGQKGSIQNIEDIDLLFIHHPNAKIKGLPLHQLPESLSCSGR